MTAKKASQNFSIRLNIHDHSFKHAKTNCGQMSWTEIKNYINFLSNNPIPKDSCMYDFETSTALDFYTERGYGMMHIKTPRTRTTSQMLIHINITDHKDCDTNHCLTNIMNGKCLDKYVIETIGKKFFADKYTNTK